MARYTGPKTRINRKFSTLIFRGDKAFERKPYLPGQHGPRLRRKVSDYSMGLNEKQKLRYFYGLTEKQFKLIFAEAKNRRGVTGEVFLELLESRLDSVIYLLGFTKSRAASRQFVTHGHIMVNGHKLNIPSYTCEPGDVIEVRARTSSKQVATRNLDDNQYRTPPAWLALEADTLRGKVSRVPTREEIVGIDINEQLIVEFYSR